MKRKMIISVISIIVACSIAVLSVSAVEFSKYQQVSSAVDGKNYGVTVQTMHAGSADDNNIITYVSSTIRVDQTGYYAYMLNYYATIEIIDSNGIVFYTTYVTDEELAAGYNLELGGYINASLPASYMTPVNTNYVIAEFTIYGIHRTTGERVYFDVPYMILTGVECNS